MSYHIARGENPASGLRRILHEQLERATNEAAGHGFEAIHSVRKRIKKTRAVMRMAKCAIGREAFCAAKSDLRKAAYSFAEMREADAHLIAFDKLRNSAGVPKSVLAETRSCLARQRRRAAAGQRKRSAEGRPILSALRDRIEDLPLARLTNKGLCATLKKTYGKGRDCLACVREEPTAENFHSRRKHTKNLWYQARLLRELDPGPLGEICETTDRLGDCLGELHDLASLRLHLEKIEALPAVETKLLFALIDAREKELMAATLALGSALFARKPVRLFVRSVKPSRLRTSRSRPNEYKSLTRA
jgi:CHAD domain-containing protein